MKQRIAAQQGEVKVIPIKLLPDNLMPAQIEQDRHGNQIISHSEKGHHHVVDGDVELLESRDSVPAGMRVIYALVRKATALKQTTTVPHDEIALLPGAYVFRISREYNPFLDQARQVND